MSSGSETTLIHLKIRPSSFDCTLCDALAMADWTQQYFFLATIFPEASLFIEDRTTIISVTLEAVQLVLLFSGFDGLSALPVVLFSNKIISLATQMDQSFTLKLE
jgi:hypothetical protein